MGDLHLMVLARESWWADTVVWLVQESRANNILPGTDKKAHLEKIRQDIRDFKKAHGLDKVNPPSKL